MNKSLTEFFEEIYKNKVFVNKEDSCISLSGPGSFPENCINYLLYLKEFLNKNNIKSVVDYGCGDFKLYKHFSWNNINYLGIDVSETAINIANQFSANNIKFLCKETIDLPKADLLIVKDVFGHWLPGNSTTLYSKDLGDQSSIITDFLNVNESKFKYIIIVDNLNGGIKKYFPNSFKYEETQIEFGGKYKKKDKKVYIKG